MIGALSTSLRGAASAQAMVDHAANNLANLNTTGYKKTRVLLQEGSTNNGQTGSGSEVAATPRNFSNGSLLSTGGSMDYAINGEGFFQVTMEDGSTAYTRDGSFHKNASGQLVTGQGLVVQGLDSSGKPAQLARFANPEGLNDIGQNLFLPTDASGAAEAGTAGQNGFGTVAQGYLEGSNSDEAESVVDMIIGQRLYEANLTALKTASEMAKEINRLA
ncbi:MAG: flagellar hook-basal body complex protein [Verrucomicrobiae bacterium]|nr:flagellar hook-basal body complex protein [Verrucomicrobiae bacterium]